MKKYKLLKDLPTFKAGEMFAINASDDLISLEHTTLHPLTGQLTNIVAYYASTLEKFPNILKDWFEEVREQPKTIEDLKDGDNCWGVTVHDGIIKPIFLVYNSKEHTDLRDVGSLWLTLKEAQDYIEFSKAEVILRRDTKGFKPDYSKEDGRGFDIFFSEDMQNLNWSFGGARDGTLRFATPEDAQESIRKHKKEWLIYLGMEDKEK